jgi:hypothetical protein
VIDVDALAGVDLRLAVQSPQDYTIAQQIVGSRVMHSV